jgi:hypothetical protein
MVVADSWAWEDIPVPLFSSKIAERLLSVCVNTSG